MRFLKFNDLGEHSLVERSGDDIPAYAIISHSWGADNEEVTYEDLIKGTGTQKPGYDKIRFCAQRSDQDGLRFFWMDTCCINKSNFTELSEAINSMFKWYREATRCYVYLPDVPDPKNPTSTVESAFANSRGFKRGWTLQELIAPSSVQFFSRTGELLGSKKSRLQQIHHITRIDIKALQGDLLSEFSIDKRMSWSRGRETKVEEDVVYCLLGIFDIHMSLIYGEGRHKAFDRLQRKVAKYVPPTAQFWAGESSLPYEEFLKPVKLQVIQAHLDDVNGVAFSPDGELLASSSDDETVRLWDARSGVLQLQQILKGHTGSTNGVAFSPDGELLASVSDDKTIRLWGGRSGVALQTLNGHSGATQAIAFSPDSKLLASASYDQTVKLWDAQSGTTIQKLVGHSASVNTVTFSPNGELLASGSSDKTIKLWDSRWGGARQTLKGHSEPISTVAFSPDGKLLVSGSQDNTIKLWDTQSGMLWKTLEGHLHTVYGVAFSPDGKLLASGSMDTTLKLWDIRLGTDRQTLDGHSSTVRDVAFSPDGKLLASASWDDTIVLWRV